LSHFEWFARDHWSRLTGDFAYGGGVSEAPSFRTWRVYDSDEVDAHLAHLHDVIDELRRQQPEAISEAETLIGRTLALAERGAEEQLAEARRQAASLLADAHDRARAIVVEAHERARRVRDLDPAEAEPGEAEPGGPPNQDGHEGHDGHERPKRATVRLRTPFP
jgi:hypothetical protein